MCDTNTPLEPASAPSWQSFSSVTEFLAVIEPGMRLCTSDFTGWADVVGVSSDGVVGRRDSDERQVLVPSAALLDLRGGHCVRIDRVRATIDAQGWEV